MMRRAADPPPHRISRPRSCIRRADAAGGLPTTGGGCPFHFLCRTPQQPFIDYLFHCLVARRILASSNSCICRGLVDADGVWDRWSFLLLHCFYCSRLVVESFGARWPTLATTHVIEKPARRGLLQLADCTSVTKPTLGLVNDPQTNPPRDPIQTVRYSKFRGLAFTSALSVHTVASVG